MKIKILKNKVVRNALLLAFVTFFNVTAQVVTESKAIAHIENYGTLNSNTYFGLTSEEVSFGGGGGTQSSSGNVLNITQVPSKKDDGRAYNVLVILMSDWDEKDADNYERIATPQGTPANRIVNIANLNAFYNNRKDPSTSDLDYRRTLPFGSRVSVSEYFYRQSISQFQISATVVKLARKSIYRKTQINRLNTYVAALPFAQAVAEYISVVNNALEEDFSKEMLKNFDAIHLYIYSEAVPAPDELVGLNNVQRSPFRNPYEVVNEKYNVWTFGNEDISEGLPVRYPCMGIGRSILKLNYIPEQAMAGFCLMSSNLAGEVAEFNQIYQVPLVSERMLRHPPSINPFYKTLLGWVQDVGVDQNSKLRGGVLHEGSTVYNYSADFTKIESNWNSLKKTYASPTSASAKNTLSDYCSPPTPVGFANTPLAQAELPRTQSFFIETRQNRGYEGGTVLKQTRGAVDPGVDDIPMNDYVAPVSSGSYGRPRAGGLAVIHGYYNKKQGRAGSLAVMDKRMTIMPTWLEDDLIEDIGLFYPNRTYAQSVRGNQITAFYPLQDDELGLGDNKKGDALLSAKPEIIVSLGLVEQGNFEIDQEAGAYDNNSSTNPNPSGGYIEGAAANDLDINALIAEGYGEFYTIDNDSLAFIKPWKDWPKPLPSIGEYIIENTFPGQFDAFGNYVPNGQYILKGDAAVVTNVNKIKVDKNQIVKEPNGLGYYDENGNYAPGGGYEPNMVNNNYQLRKRAVDGFYGVGQQRVIFSPLELENNVINPPAAGWTQDISGLYGYVIDPVIKEELKKVFKSQMGITNGIDPSPIGNSLINTAACLEFSGFSYGPLNEILSSINRRSFTKMGSNRRAVEEINPHISNVSTTNELMTFEICSQKNYSELYNRNLNPGEREEFGIKLNDGFLGIRFENELGVSMQAEEVKKGEPGYNGYLQGIFARYVEKRTVDYGKSIDPIRLGVWNKGGQNIDFEIIPKNVDKNGKGIISFEASNYELKNKIVGNDSLVYRYTVNFEKIYKLHAGTKFPWKGRMQVAEVQWKKYSSRTDKGKTCSSEVYFDYIIKSPARLITGSKPQFDNLDDIIVNRDLNLVAPVYAKTVEDSFVVVNRGRVRDNTKGYGASLANVIVNAAKLPNDANGNPVQWFFNPTHLKTENGITVKDGLSLAVPGLNFVTIPVRLNMISYLRNSKKPLSNINKIDIFAFSKERDVNATWDPNNLSSPQIQSVIAKIQIENKLPPAIEWGFISEEIYDSKRAESPTWNKYITYNTSIVGKRVYLNFTPVEYVNLYGIFITRDLAKNQPSNEDFVYMIDGITSDNQILSFSLPEMGKTYKMWIRAFASNDPEKEQVLRNSFQAVEQINFNGGDPVNLPNLFEPIDRAETLNLITTMSAGDYTEKSLYLGDLSISHEIVSGTTTAPLYVIGTSDLENEIFLQWAIERNFQWLNGLTSFQGASDFACVLWRSSSMNFLTAEEIYQETIETDLAEFSYSDRDTSLIPGKSYYYWVTIRCLDTDEDSQRSRMGDGKLKIPPDYYDSVVDDSNDSDFSEKYQRSGNVQAVAIYRDGSIEMSETGEVVNGKLAFYFAATPSTRNSSSNSNIASISRNINLEEFKDEKAGVSFDYRFSNADANGYIEAKIDGKTIFFQKANLENTVWKNTGMLDISFITGKVGKLEIRFVADVVNPNQSIWVKDIFVGTMKLEPCWELFSSPIVGKKLKDVLKVPFSNDASLIKWNYEDLDYDNQSNINDYNLKIGDGYWFFMAQPLKKGDVEIGTPAQKRNNAPVSQIKNLKSGWNLVAPSKNTFLFDNLGAPDANYHYLNDYPILAKNTIKRIYNEKNKRYETANVKMLDVLIWSWDAKNGSYREEADTLDAGKAYWIFKY